MVIICIQLAFRSLSIPHFCSAKLSLTFSSFLCPEKNWREVVDFNLKPCFVLLGIHLQSLHLSNLQQIFRRYGGKRTFPPFNYHLIEVSIINMLKMYLSGILC